LVYMWYTYRSCTAVIHCGHLDRLIGNTGKEATEYKKLQ
jgi:hypothetical protein